MKSVSHFKDFSSKKKKTGLGTKQVLKKKYLLAVPNKDSSSVINPHINTYS